MYTVTCIRRCSSEHCSVKLALVRNVCVATRRREARHALKKAGECAQKAIYVCCLYHGQGYSNDIELRREAQAQKYRHTHLYDAADKFLQNKLEDAIRQDE